jgi:hypothetical protein
MFGFAAPAILHRATASVHVVAGADVVPIPTTIKTAAVLSKETLLKRRIFTPLPCCYGNSPLALAPGASGRERPPPWLLRLHNGHETGPIAARTLPFPNCLFRPIGSVGAHRFPRLILLIIFEQLGVRVYDFTVLRHWDVKAGTTKPVGEPDRLRHGVGILSPVIEGFEAQTRSI